MEHTLEDRRPTKKPRLDPTAAFATTTTRKVVCTDRIAIVANPTLSDLPVELIADIIERTKQRKNDILKLREVCRSFRDAGQLVLDAVVSDDRHHDLANHAFKRGAVSGRRVARECIEHPDWVANSLMEFLWSRSAGEGCDAVIHFKKRATDEREAYDPPQLKGEMTLTTAQLGGSFRSFDEDDDDDNLQPDTLVVRFEDCDDGEDQQFTVRWRTTRTTTDDDIIIKSTRTESITEWLIERFRRRPASSIPLPTPIWIDVDTLDVLIPHFSWRFISRPCSKETRNHEATFPVLSHIRWPKNDHTMQVPHLHHFVFLMTEFFAWRNAFAADVLTF